MKKLLIFIIQVWMFYIVEVVEQCDCSWDKTISCVVMFKDTSCQKSRKSQKIFWISLPTQRNKQTKNQYWANRVKKIVPYFSCHHHWSQILYCHCDLAGNWSRTKFLPQNMLAPPSNNYLKFDEKFLQDL